MIYHSLSMGSFFMLFCVILLLSSCKTAGLYTSNPQGKMAFAGTEFRLTKTDSFDLTSWTDSYSRFVDENGKQIFIGDSRYRGFGTYQCLGDSMELTFCNEDSIKVELEILRNENLIEISIHIYNELGVLQRPDVFILDSEKKRIYRKPNEYKDVFHFEFSNDDNPRFIELRSRWLNVENPIIDIVELEDGKHIVRKKSYNGYFAQGVKKIWFKKVFTGIRYELNDRKRYLPKKFGWKWVNKLYRDY